MTGIVLAFASGLAIGAGTVLWWAYSLRQQRDTYRRQRDVYSRALISANQQLGDHAKAVRTADAQPRTADTPTFDHHAADAVALFRLNRGPK